MRGIKSKKIVYTALCLAAALLLPQVFHFLPAANAGAVFLPMHIPVLICGFLCGWPYGALCGILAPLLSSSVTGMPVIFPVGVSMVFELSTYGALSGIFYRAFGGRVYPALIAAMAGGRAVAGIMNAVLYGVSGKAYGVETFITGTFITALPGIVAQIIIIPAVIYALKRAKITQ